MDSGTRWRLTTLCEFKSFESRTCEPQEATALARLHVFIPRWTGPGVSLLDAQRLQVHLP